MCLISIKPNGVPLTDFFLEGITAGAESNDDGHGYMLKRKDSSEFIFAKGMWSGSELARKVEELKVAKDDILCVHNRMSTHGRKNSYNCHPFLVLPAERPLGWNEMLNTEGTTKLPLLMHNGIFGEFGYSKNFSDTFNFVKDFISAKEVLEYSQSIVWLEKKIGGNKLAILHPKLGLVRLGHYQTENGYYFSNNGYKSYKYTYYKGQQPVLDLSDREWYGGE